MEKIESGLKNKKVVVLGGSSGIGRLKWHSWHNNWALKW
jgi:hypothetical protein